MAPALGRRRGTKKSRQRHGLLSTILGGMALIGVGLVIGLVFGIFAISGPSSDRKEKIEGVVNLLRKPKAPVDVHPPTTYTKPASFPILTHAFPKPKPEHAEASLPRNDPGQMEAARQAFEQHQHHGGVRLGQEQHLHGGIVSNGAGGMQTASSVSDFVARTPTIGGHGPFPYYPTEGLVSPTHDFTTFTAPGGSRFEEWKLGDSPYDYAKGESDALARSRRIHVRHAMEHAWGSYQKYAFGFDEILPQKKIGSNNWGGLGTTLVDSLDTLYLMNMTTEFKQARDWVESSLSHDKMKAVSVFETTIRSLGGLLSAYDWSGDTVFLNHAKDLGTRLFRSFQTESGLPTQQINLKAGGTVTKGWNGNNLITAEFGTLQIEFRFLARMSGVQDYKTKSERIYDILREMNPDAGLYPNFVRTRGGKPEFSNSKITFGAMGDSLYEYMLKIWIQGGKTETKYRTMYDKSIQGMHDRLLQVSTPSNLVFIADRNSGNLDLKMDHLVCFMGGLLALGAYTDPQGLQSERAQRDLKTGKVSRRKKRTNVQSLQIDDVLECTSYYVL
jgi:hypothetical protein